MIFVIYALIAAAVTLLSIKAADYVELVDKKTSLSGAFIGGILLSAVTSLPELFTSLSSTLLLDEPGLCIGNILGSNLFNLTALAVMIVLFSRTFAHADIAHSHQNVLWLLLAAYGAIALNMLGVLSMELFTVSITSIILIACYAASVKYLSGEDSGEDDAEDTNPLTLKQVLIRFALVAVGIVVLSILISQVTDMLAEELNLGKSLAGALFMGVATSLPELSSTIALFRKKCFDIAVGNIVGSNIFNLIILSVSDVLYTGTGLYDFSDSKTVALLVFGFLAHPLILCALKLRHRWVQVGMSVGAVASYVGFLTI